MCGICGEIRFDGADAQAPAIARMMAVLAPRGPDHGDSMQMGQVGFGHRRLAIIDLSPRGNQPMRDPQTGCALVFNGTIYNYRELRRELQAHGQVFQSDSDTEVILKAYAEWGENCVSHFTGIVVYFRLGKYYRRTVVGYRPVLIETSFGHAVALHQD